MKKCTNCGAEFEYEVTVCPNCGQEEAPAAVEPEKENAATAPVTLSTVMGLVTLLYPMGIPAMIMSIIGVVLGAKEKKAKGKSLGLVLNIISLVLTSLGMLGLIVYFILYFILVFGALAGSGTLF